MPDGNKWDVPAEFIAQHRARYYVTIDKETSFDKEVKFALEDEYKLINWTANMDWKDVMDVARRVEETSVVNYHEGWIKGAKEIVTKEYK